MNIISLFGGTAFLLGSVSALGWFTLSLVRKLLYPGSPAQPVSLNTCPAAFLAGAALYTCAAFLVSLAGAQTVAWHFFALCGAVIIADILIKRGYGAMPPTPIMLSSSDFRRAERAEASAAWNEGTLVPEGSRRSGARDGRRKSEELNMYPTPYHRIWLDTLPAAALCLGAGALLVNFLFAAAFPQFDIDMIAHILIKSRVLTSATYHNAVYFRDPVFANVHTNYPPLPGFLFNLLFLFGINDVSGYLLINTCVTFMIAAALNAFLDENHITPTQRAFWIIVFLSTNGLINSQFILSSIDLMLALALFLAAAALIRTLASKDPWDLFLLSLWTAVALLIKRDALLFAPLIALILIGRRPSSLPRFLLILAAIAGPWYVFCHWLPTAAACGEDPFFKPTGLASLLTAAPAAFHTAVEVLTQNWNASFVIVLPASIMLIWKRNTAGMWLALVLAWLMGAYILAMWCYIGVITSYKNTLFRLLVHIYPVALAILALATAALLSRSPAAQDHHPETPSC